MEERSPYQDKSKTSVSSKISIDVQSKTNTRPSSTLRNNLNDYGIKDFKLNKNSKLIKQLVDFINNDKCLSQKSSFSSINLEDIQPKNIDVVQTKHRPR